MQIDIITLFPGMFDGPLTESILKRAQEKGLLTVRLRNLRDYTADRHRTGTILRMAVVEDGHDAGPLAAAIEVRGDAAQTP
jgi:hypothetical protein